MAGYPLEVKGTAQERRVAADVAYDAQTIRRRVVELGECIRNDLDGHRPLLIAILQGSVVFLADLVRELGVDADIDFMSVSSYPGRQQPGGVVRIIKDPEFPITRRDVILVEDIVDTGLTLAFLLRTLEARSPNSLRVCALIDKPVRRIADPEIDYWGFQTDEFLVGYGLDFKGRYRNYPHLMGVKDVAALAADPKALDYLFDPAEAQI